MGRIISMARALAHIEKVHNIRPIEGADRIEQVRVLGWNIIVKKDEFKDGDLCIYVEIDSKMPASDDRFNFLAAKDYKIKTMKMRGTISQGIVFHLSDFPEIKEPKEGMDVTDILGVTKIVTAEEQRLAKEEKGVDPFKIKLNRVYTNHKKFAKSKFGQWCLQHNWTKRLVVAFLGGPAPKPLAFPTHLTSKTDEVRIENAPWLLGTGPYIVTEKIDGSSATYILEKKRFGYEFYVCSRNVRQLDEAQQSYYDENIYWEQAIKYDLHTKMKYLFKMLGCKKTLVLQGEVAGPKVQATKYGLAERDLFLFNIKVDGDRYSTYDLANIANSVQLKTVPILGSIDKLPETIEEMKTMAEGQSAIGPCLREGLVYRGVDGQVSFKNVSNSFLLKQKD